jgi:hypothetical protein
MRKLQNGANFWGKKTKSHYLVYQCPMRYRKLRIAFSSVCGIACLLLIVLWVRSYWWADAIGRGTTSNGTVTVLTSNHGAIVIGNGVAPASASLPAEITDRWGPISDSARPYNRRFSWTSNRREIRIQLPTWLPLLFAAGLAVVPWIRWRFGLRTLLIGMTLISLALGAAIYAAGRS